MRIKNEISKILTGTENTIAVNGDYTHTQITIGGRDTDTVTATARPLLENNGDDDFEDEEFEMIDGGQVDLSLYPRKRTFTINNKRLSALRFVFTGDGDYKVDIRSWGRITN